MTRPLTRKQWQTPSTPSVGVGGIDQVEARAKYLASREKLLHNHVAVTRIEKIQHEKMFS